MTWVSFRSVWNGCREWSLGVKRLECQRVRQINHEEGGCVAATKEMREKSSPKLFLLKQGSVLHRKKVVFISGTALLNDKPSLFTLFALSVHLQVNTTLYIITTLPDFTTNLWIFRLSGEASNWLAVCLLTRHVRYLTFSLRCGSSWGGNVLCSVSFLFISYCVASISKGRFQYLLCLATKKLKYLWKRSAFPTISAGLILPSKTAAFKSFSSRHQRNTTVVQL